MQNKIFPHRPQTDRTAKDFDEALDDLTSAVHRVAGNVHAPLSARDRAELDAIRRKNAAARAQDAHTQRVLAEKWKRQHGGGDR